MALTRAQLPNTPNISLSGSVPGDRPSMLDEILGSIVAELAGSATQNVIQGVPQKSATDDRNVVARLLGPSKEELAADELRRRRNETEQSLAETNLAIAEGTQAEQANIFERATTESQARLAESGARVKGEKVQRRTAKRADRRSELLFEQQQINDQLETALKQNEVNRLETVNAQSDAFNNLRIENEKLRQSLTTFDLERRPEEFRTSQAQKEAQTRLASESAREVGGQADIIARESASIDQRLRDQNVEALIGNLPEEQKIQAREMIAGGFSIEQVKEQLRPDAVKPQGFGTREGPFVPTAPPVLTDEAAAAQLTGALQQLLAPPPVKQQPVIPTGPIPLDPNDPLFLQRQLTGRTF